MGLLRQLIQAGIFTLTEMEEVNTQIIGKQLEMGNLKTGKLMVRLSKNVFTSFFDCQNQTRRHFYR